MGICASLTWELGIHSHSVNAVSRLPRPQPGTPWQPPSPFVLAFIPAGRTAWHQKPPDHLHEWWETSHGSSRSGLVPRLRAGPAQLQIHAAKLEATSTFRLPLGSWLREGKYSSCGKRYGASRQRDFKTRSLLCLVPCLCLAAPRRESCRSRSWHLQECREQQLRRGSQLTCRELSFNVLSRIRPVPKVAPDS